GNVDAKDMYVFKLTRADGSSSYHGDMQAFLRLDRQDLNDIYRWKLYEGYGVHTLFMDGKPMEINMLVEKKYPLVKELLEKMLNLQLESEEENFKSLAKEADESLAKHKALELEIERLLRAVASQDIMSIVQSNSVIDTLNLQTELDRTKEKLENCIIKKEKEYVVLWNNWYTKYEE
ncbi:hypothetical protein Tco_1445098, partial [Tanacetum coccineum]